MEKKRTDDELLKLASKCLEENITTLNVVCFVSKVGDTHRLDIEAFKKVTEYLGEKYSAISMMILTHCDEYPDKVLNSPTMYNLCFYEVGNIPVHVIVQPIIHYYWYNTTALKLFHLLFLLKDRISKYFEESVRHKIIE
jgi:hypothetical protein